MKIFSKKLLQDAFFSTLAFAMFDNVQAQVVQIPGSVRPGQIEQQLKELPTPKADRPAVDVIPQQSIPDTDQGAVAFQLKGIKFSGATVYPEVELQHYFAELQGNTVTLNQLRTAANNVSARYRNDGYVLAQVIIPKQALRDGVVHLEVLEGRINDVKIQGDAGSDVIGLLEGYVSKIRQTLPVNIDQV
ncbi:MAG: POTRA domain-containing protein [Methylomonas sp.]|nr:POTRA domain-containing protein [Methylomonas sp.]